MKVYSTARRGGGPNPEKVGPVRVEPRRVARSGGAAGVSHDCTFEGPGLQRHHQNSTRGPLRERRKKEISGGRERKKAKYWAVQGKGGPAEGSRGPGERPKNLEHTHHTHKTTTNRHPPHTHNNNKNNTQHINTTTTTTENLAKTLKHQNWGNTVK